MTKTPPIPKKPSAARMQFAGRLGVPSTMQVPNNMSAEETTPINFRVAKEFHREFKMTAVAHGISMRDLLEQSFQLWKDKNQS